MADLGAELQELIDKLDSAEAQISIGVWPIGHQQHLRQLVKIRAQILNAIELTQALKNEVDAKRTVL